MIKFFSIFLLLCSLLYGQETKLSEDKLRIFTSISEAKKVNPDSVFAIQLGNNGLKEFPKEILEFRNLELVDLIDRNIGEIYLEDPKKLTEKDQLLAKQIFEKHGGYDIRTDVIGLFPIRNKNTFKSVPIDVIKLKKLNQLMIPCKSISKKTKQKILENIPGCTISCF
jgi:hypothetical protein